MNPPRMGGFVSTYLDLEDIIEEDEEPIADQGNPLIFVINIVCKIVNPIRGMD